MQRSRQPGTPNRQVQSARKAQPAATADGQSVADSQLWHCSRRNPRYRASRERAGFATGLALGAAAAALVFCLVMFLWVIPTMDAALAAVVA